MIPDTKLTTGGEWNWFMQSHSLTSVIIVGTRKNWKHFCHVQWLSRAHKQQLSKAEFSPFIITQYRIWYRWCYKKANNQLVTKQNTETTIPDSIDGRPKRWPNAGPTSALSSRRWPSVGPTINAAWDITENNISNDNLWTRNTAIYDVIST